MLKIKKTKLDGVLIIKPPTIFKDFRGFYVETYNEKIYKTYGIKQKFIQDDNLEDNNYYQCRHHKDNNNFTDQLKCGHLIHNDCLYEIYRNSMIKHPDKEILCPYCRDHDPDNFYNRQRLKLLEDWQREDVITKMLENKLSVA